jgi:hypothetical protein
MEVLVRLDGNPNLVALLQRLQETALLVAEKIGHRGVGLDHDPATGHAPMIPLNLTKDLVTDGLLGLEMPFALTVEAGLA